MRKAEQEKAQQRQEKPIIEEPTTDVASPTQLPVVPVAGTGDAAVGGQATRLGDSRMQTAQRQAMAAQIGRLHGNRHLQRVVASMGRHRDATHPSPPGSTQRTDNAATVQGQMGPGRTLESSTRAGMESAFGQDFSQVKVHADAEAAELSQHLDAQAFTVGEHIAFEAGAYQPGTLIGDALIAHELAHVTQQRGTAPTSLSMQREELESGGLERDANMSTVQAMAAFWYGAKRSLARLGHNVGPSLQTGLRIQRCSHEDRARVEAIRAILETTPSGRRALALKEEYDVEVRAGRSGGGSFYDSSSNSMSIDPDESNESAALTFVHEMNHARYFHEGIGADAASQTREEYVNGMVEEEAEGTVRSIETKIELEGTDIDVSGTTFPLETEYRQAHRAAVDAARAEDPERSDADLQRIGRAAGKQRVTQGFTNGEVVTSTTPQKPYPQYYGEYWDEVHAE